MIARKIHSTMPHAILGCLLATAVVACGGGSGGGAPAPGSSAKVTPTATSSSTVPITAATTTAPTTTIGRTSTSTTVSVPVPSSGDCPIKDTNVASTGTTQLVFNASRWTGVAPLAVFFDATGSTSTSTARPFHDLDFQWNFGDDAQAKWANGSQAGASHKNLAKGPVAGHVFETPGIKTISLTDTKSGATYSCAIHVQDPDLVFAGSKTKCFSRNNDFSGCPAEATLVNVPSGNFGPEFEKYEPTQSRLLIQRGEVWTSNAALIIKSTGPAMLGAIPGTKAKPVINSSPNGNKVMVFSQTSMDVLRGKAVDWRVVDLDLTASGDNAGAIGGNGAASQITILRLNIHDVYSGISLSPGNGTGGKYDLFDQIAISENRVTNITGTFGSIGMFLGLSRSAVLGNYVDNNMKGEQVLRFPYAHKLAISNNTVMRPLPEKNMFKIHSFIYARLPMYSQEVVVSDNLFDNRNGAYGVLGHITIGSGGGDGTERVRQVIVERNLFYSATNDINGATAVEANAPDITIRNNIANFSAPSTYKYANIHLVQVDYEDPAYPAERVHIYNNTMYSTNATAEVGSVVRIMKSLATNISVKNNILFMPNLANPVVLYNGSGSSSVTVANNSTNPKLSPGFAAQPPVALSDWRVTAGSYAINTGAVVPVAHDFSGSQRTGLFSMGAVTP